MPSPTMRPLVDFLNHGLLPFVGRESLVERLVDFWSRTGEGEGLQTMLLLGEAGVGKSRILEEAASRVTAAGGAVVHVKLFPESATSLVPLLARGLWRYGSAHAGLNVEPEETLPSVIGALRRLARLRQTLLVVEDLHLLSGAGVATFAALLDALGDEQLRLLALSRPGDLAARGLIERSLVEEVEIAGLTSDGIGDLWNGLFGSSAEPAIIDTLHHITNGNPLALRSALRGALKSHAINVDAASGRWSIDLPVEAFAAGLRRSVELLSEGMAAHLSDEERRAAETISTLGEVVARESALRLVNQGEGMLELLAFKGVLVESGALMPPLPGRPSHAPLLTFTHSLLHKRLVAAADHLDPLRLLTIVADDLPLYSVVPFEVLLDRGALTGVTPDLLRRLMERIMRILSALNGSPDWELGMTVWRFADLLVESNVELLEEGELLQLRALLIHMRLQLMFRGSYDAEYRELVDRLDLLTAEAATPSMMESRLHLLTHRLRLQRRVEYAGCAEIARQAWDLVDRHRAVAYTSGYLNFLVERVTSARTTADVAAMREVEHRLTTLLDDPAFDEGARRRARRMIAPYVADLADTDEEAERKLAELDRLIEEEKDVRLTSMKALFLHGRGYLEEAVRIIRHDLIPVFRLSGLLYNVLQSEAALVQSSSAAGAPLEEVAAAARRIAAAAQPGIRTLILQTLASHLPYEGILRGDPRWGLDLLRELIGDDPSRATDAHRFLLLAVGEIDAASLLLPSSGEATTIVARLAVALRDRRVDDELIEQLREQLSSSLFRTSDLMLRRLLLDTIADAEGEPGGRLRDALATELQQGLVTALEWCTQRKLATYATSLLERHGSLLPRGEQTRWKSRIAAAGRVQLGGRPREDERIRISMLGRIGITRPGGEESAPRGVRLRTLLGLMVADRMLDRPLTQREFYRLSAPDLPDFEDTRKTLNLTVHRLRDAIGYTTISTEGETPSLNLEEVSVDLLTVARLLEEANDAVRGGALPRARLLLLEALEIVGAEVPFPGLYDDFFEAAREDFENRLRAGVMRVTQGLMREGDESAAEAILSRAFTAMPGDEELATLLSEVLVTMGRRTDAERVRLQVEEGE